MKNGLIAHVSYKLYLIMLRVLVIFNKYFIIIPIPHMPPFIDLIKLQINSIYIYIQYIDSSKKNKVHKLRKTS